MQVYIGEVSPPTIRGRLGALFELSMCVGILLVYLLGTWITYWQLAFVCTAFSVVQFALMFTIQESDRLSRNPLKNVRVCLGKRQSDLVEDRGDKATTVMTETASQKNSSCKLKSYIPRITIVCILMAIQALSGLDAITSLAGPIFRAAELDKGGLSSGLLASLAVGVVMTVFTLLSLCG